MSAVLPETDFVSQGGQVRDVPKAEVGKPQFDGPFWLAEREDSDSVRKPELTEILSHTV
jgi:hypothetical protein